MRKTLLTFLLTFILSFTTHAHYSIHSATSGVKVESGNVQKAATKGMQLKATDYVVVPAGGEVEVYNDLDKRIYRSTTTGKISVTRLMMDARKIASDNRQNVASRLRFGKKEKADDGRRVYVEKGMVRRSLATFDPEAENLQMDSRTLGRHLAQKLLSGANLDATAMPVNLTHGPIDGHGLFFRVVNNIEFPVYFNILKIGGADANGVLSVEISVLGQPDGSYVLLPGQGMTRENFADLPEGERHLMVMTHCRYDLDEVIDEIGKALQNPDFTTEEKQPLPVYVMTL